MTDKKSKTYQVKISRVYTVQVRVSDGFVDDGEDWEGAAVDIARDLIDIHQWAHRAKIIDMDEALPVLTEIEE